MFVFRKIVNKLVNGFIIIYRTLFMKSSLLIKRNSVIIAYREIYRMDAIGYDSLIQYSVLKKSGSNVYLYAEKFDRSLFHKILLHDQFMSLIEEKSNILIIHYGNYWPGVEKIIDRANCKICIKYHNITPAKFFKTYDPVIAKEIDKGYKQIRLIAKIKKISLYLPASPYNAQQLQKMGVGTDKMVVIPPFHKTDQFKRLGENKKLKKKLCNGYINILFVGRIAPNKGHIHLIKTIYAYLRKYKNKKICLYIVGGGVGGAYYEKLNSIVDQYNMHDNVSFVGQVDTRDLNTYYRNSHVFLLLSEHEGFCVPILEAQFQKIPIVCLDKTAVRNTLGKGQCIHTKLNYSLFADSIYKIINDSHFRERLINSGYNNYSRYSSEIISARLLQIIGNISL